MKVTFIGHAAFYLEDESANILIDPFIGGNPKAALRPEDVSPDIILITHGHGDHLGDAVEIARANDSLIVSTYELANLCSQQGVARVHGIHIGGRFEDDFGYVRATMAVHGAGVPGGQACGFIVNLDGRTIYHAGDTGLTYDMKLLSELEPQGIDLAMLPIGGNYTMDWRDATIAATWIRPRMIIPMHYNTHDLILTDPQDFKRAVEAEGESTVAILRPGEWLSM